MDFVFLSCPTFEEWDWSNPLEVGIGGSETSHVEMAQRLRRRGHSVYSYAPTPFDDVRVDPAGVPWERCDKGDFTRPGVWVIYRDPEMVDGMREGNPCWLICQDTQYSTMTPARAARLDRIVSLCADHAAHMKKLYPYAADKIFVSSNGIRSDLVSQALTDQAKGRIPRRDPRRLMFASSPDRGLWALLQIFERVREVLPEITLHVYYGFNNIEKVIPGAHPRVAQMRANLLSRMNGPGIVHHGRIGQRAMAREWVQAGVWCMPSQFTETSCITCMDAQASGAIPVTTPIWAIGENVQHGVMVEGLPESDPLTKARYAHELMQLITDEPRQDRIRAAMIPWALEHFNWERFTTQWERWATIDLEKYRSSAIDSRQAAPLAVCERQEVTA